MSESNTLSTAFQQCLAARLESPECTPATRRNLSAWQNEDLAAAFGKYLPQADNSALDVFVEELNHIDIGWLRRHRKALHEQVINTLSTDDVEPFGQDATQAEHSAEDALGGVSALKAGRVAVLVFAGGSGTRFFSQWDKLSEALPHLSEALRAAPPEKDAPKGCFPITAVQGLSFYQKLAAEVLATGIAAGKLPPLCFMTSSNTHAHTIRWLAEDALWGLPKEAVLVFRQHEIPRLDEDGDLIIAPDGHLFWTGNGHGGVFAALAAPLEEGGAPLERLKAWGVEHLFMGNVDNAELAPLDCGRIGYHLRKGGDFTMSVVSRVEPLEKVGLVCKSKRDGHVEVIEYSVLDPELARAADGRGGLLFNAAHINSNLLTLAAWRDDLPGTLYTGKPIEVGGRKIKSSTYEMLNQHLATRLAPDRVQVYAAPREGFFAPTKAIVGADSVSTTFKAQTQRAAKLMRELGATLAGTDEEPEAFVELHPALGLSLEELRARGIGRNWQLAKGSRLYICARHGIGAAPLIGEGLILEEGASLIVRVKRPYGSLRFDPRSRDIAEDAASAGRVQIGKNVVVKAGIRALIDVDEAGRVIVPDDTVFPKHSSAHVSRGASLTFRR